MNKMIMAIGIAIVIVGVILVIYNVEVTYRDYSHGVCGQQEVRSIHREEACQKPGVSEPRYFQC